MAFIHTNFLTGNDTTGNGSTGTPYKTVYKALQVAVSNDFIKVAGGQWSAALSGDFTFTLNSNSVTTSVSQVGVVLVDDILSFEDGQFGFDKFHLKVTAVAAGSITLAQFWSGPTITTNTVKRLDAYHYSQAGATPNTFESWTTTDIQPNGRTGITISGGWSSDFTTQGGWTVSRRTGQAGTVSSQSPVTFTFTPTGGIGDWGANLLWDRFLNHTTQAIWANANNSNSSFAIKEVASVRGSFLSGINSGFGLWQPDSLTPVKIYISSPGSSSLQYINANISGLTSQPDVCEMDVYGTLSFVNVNTASNQVAGVGMFSRIGQEGSKNQMNLYVRQNVWTNGATPAYPTSLLWQGTNGVYMKKLTYYCNVPQPIMFGLNVNQTIQVEDIELLGAGAAQSGLYWSYNNAGQVIIDLSAEGKTIDSFKPGLGNAASDFPTFDWYFNRLCQNNLSPVQVTDVEGLKTMDIYNNIYFKNNGDLKVSSGTSFNTANGVLYIPKLLGVVEKPTAQFTVNFTLKVDTGAEAKWDQLLLQYGPNLNQVITQALTPTDSYATYSVTVDPANYTDWAKFKFPLYFGIRAASANTYNNEAMTYAYIQSITVA